MKVTPLDIRRKEFRRSVRGYLDEDVDVFLDTVADEVERVSKVNTELLDKVKSLEEQVAGHAHIREALEKTLVAAQLQSEEIRSKAQKESQSMLREAEAKAKAVVDDFYEKTRAVQQTLMQLKLLEEDFRFKFKGMLEGYIKLLDNGPLVTPLENIGDGTATSAASAVPEAPGAVGEDSPTSETAGQAVDSGVEAPAAASAKPVASPAQPSGPSKPAAAVKSKDIADDLTVETKPTPVPSTSAGAKADAEAQVQQKGSGVYFGKTAGDSDDPFPEMEGDHAKPRDFRW